MLRVPWHGTARKNDGGGTRSLCAPPPSFWGNPYPLFLSKQPQRFVAQRIAQCLIGEGALFQAAQTLGKVMHWVGAGVDDAVFEDMVGRIREFVGLGDVLDMYIQIKAQIDVGAEHGKGQRLGYMRPASVRDDDLHLGMLLGDPHDLIRIRIGHVRAHKKTRRERNDESVPLASRIDRLQKRIVVIQGPPPATV